jgi:hypothetical protein
MDTRRSELGAEAGLAVDRIAPLRRLLLAGPPAGAALLVVLLVAAFVIVAVSPLRTTVTVWDDAYMFVRYADHLLASGTLSWNPHGPPTYGLTSILYLVVAVVPMRILIPRDPLPTLVASSCLGAAAFLALALRLAWRATDGLARASRWNVLLLVVASLLLQGEALSSHATSGMDTTFAMAFEAAYLLVALRSERSRSVPLAVFLGVMGGGAITARPDLMIFSLAVPAVALITKDLARARRARLTLAITVAVCLLWLAVARAYLGSALPLSFYAKSTGLYRDFNVAKYAPVPLVQWKAFAWPNGILLALGFLPIVFAPSAFLRDAPSTVKGAMVGVVVFAAYYLIFVLQIMNAYARFYYPLLPAIVLAGAYGARCLLQRTREVPFVLSLALVAAVFPHADVLGSPLGFLRYDVAFSSRSILGNVLFALDRFSLLPDDLVIAATEVGHLGAMNPRKTVIDLAGLNDTEFGRHPFSAKRLMSLAPDLIYLPHPDYRGMNADILADPEFRARYELHSREELQALPVAIRLDSPHYAAMERIVDEARRK